MAKAVPAEIGLTVTAYRVILKSWTLTVAGMQAGDEAALCIELDRLDPVLENIAKDYPALAYTVDVLINARRRSFASMDKDRPARGARS